ncbi:MAG: ABC transporter ATP-binding protein, partial [Ilumatobacteraceae bacterium]
LMAAMFPTVGLIVNVSSVAVLWVGANRLNNDQLQVGTIVAYLSYLVQILMAVVMSTFAASMMPRAAVAADRIQEVLDTPSTVVAPADPVTEVAEHGTLEFRDVGFRYPGAEQPVLEGISFRIAAGETTAIIGSTGAGKTTLVNLVPRLFDVTDGAVLVDGVDVRRLDLDLLWSKIGYVPQRPFLFSGTVASNLRYGRPEATEAELWEALEVAQAADFVKRMPAGLDSPIDQGGTNVSGGQRQRLAIARALVVRPEIYVFDGLVLGARPRDRRSAPRRPRSVHEVPRRSDRCPAGLHHHQVPRSDPRGRRRTDRRARPPRRVVAERRDLRRDRGVPDG